MYCQAQVQVLGRVKVKVSGWNTNFWTFLDHCDRVIGTWTRAWQLFIVRTWEWAGCLGASLTGGRAVAIIVETHSGSGTGVWRCHSVGHQGPGVTLLSTLFRASLKTRTVTEYKADIRTYNETIRKLTQNIRNWEEPNKETKVCQSGNAKLSSNFLANSLRYVHLCYYFVCLRY